MQLLITHDSSARTRVIRLSRWQWGLSAAAVLALLLVFSGAVYHMVFLKAARDGWPVVGQLVRLVVRDEIEQQDRYMRLNLDAMAQKVGEMQAKLIKLEAMGERVARVANVKPEDIEPLQRPTSAASDATTGLAAEPANSLMGLASLSARGGPFVPGDRPSLQVLQDQLQSLDEATELSTDLYTLFESRLLESQLSKLTIPSQMPMVSMHTSGFGFRSDPFTGRRALHTGLDFPAEIGTEIYAAAGGVVSHRETHPAYGEMIEIDHGNNVVTRYAHCSAIDVKLGSVVRKGQAIARVGSTGRSTGPHLHFEVLVNGVQRDPVRFLAGMDKLPAAAFAARPGTR